MEDCQPTEPEAEDTDMKDADSDEPAESIGQYEEEDYSQDYVQLPDGRTIPIWEYLGPIWDSRIVCTLSVFQRLFVWY